MIKTNINLDFIEEYKPSDRIDDGGVKKLDWNECNLPYDEDYSNILLSSLLSINYTEYPNINNKNLLSKLSSYCGVEMDNVQIFNGSDSALHYILATFLNKDTNVLIYYPNYSQIETYVRLYSNNVNHSEINDLFGEHKYNFYDVIHNEVIYISNPNNPTGFCLEPEIIESLLKKYPNKLFIIDEAYYEFSNKSCSKLVSVYNNLIVTRTFSKAFSLASIRLGYICANSVLMYSINKIRNTKEVNSFAQKLGEVAIDNFSYIQKRIDIIKSNKEKLQKILSDNKIDFIKSEANFVLIRVLDSKKIIKELSNLKILVRDRSMFKGLENTIRVTIGEWCDMEIIINTILKQNEYK
jgi:histidinol-phosphate aminotransferase